MRKFCAILVALQAVAVCSALNVVTVPNGNLVAIEGDRNVNLLCKIPGGQSIDFCIVKVPGVRAPFASSDRLPAPVAGISFYGEGWSKGSCGITLATIKPEHDGTFECTLSVKGQSYKGSIEIMVQGEAVAPEPPVIEISSNVDGSNGEFDYGKPLIARCISRQGWPGARLSWYLDGAKVAGDQLGAAFSETKDRRTTVQQFFRKPVAVEDNRKQLVCRAEHPKYPQGYVEVALPIKLRKSSNSDNEIKVDSKVSKVQPSAPRLIVSSDISSLKAGSTLVVECISEGGQPAASFLWFMDDQLIYEGLSTPFLTKDSRGSITVQQVLQRTLTASDNGKALICKARHPSGVQETRLRLAVN
ncbi:fasciclin [Culex quinquefasciatus]|uniref:Fasciclin n=1 Tax=Culex quinquefasciatus TaxID=7176 RepID=B0WDB6_CULQU|nr:fasciclin [Culex quinquefasciatus]|eukprot:XP_001846700.1 fasciclin [Culex quinquefasciatus]